MKIDNRMILIFIAVSVAGIFSVMLIQANKRTPAEKVSDSISNVIDSAGKNIN